MQAQALTPHEVAASLQHRVEQLISEGLSAHQAIAAVSRRLELDPIKVAVLLGHESP